MRSLIGGIILKGDAGHDNVIVDVCGVTVICVNDVVEDVHVVVCNHERIRKGSASGLVIALPEYGHTVQIGLGVENLHSVNPYIGITDVTACILLTQVDIDLQLPVLSNISVYFHIGLFYNKKGKRYVDTVSFPNLLVNS